MQFETLSFGYGLVEAPRANEKDWLYFSDVRNGGVYRWRAPDLIETVLPDRRNVGGIIFNESGGILVTGQGLILFDERTRQIRDVFVDWRGTPLLALNDATTDDCGSIYTGSLNYEPLRDQKPVPGSLFRIDPPGRATELWDGIKLSNGLGFSPDRKLLYHSDTTTGAVWVFDALPDRTVKDRRVFAKLPEGWPDGLAVDVEGGVWVAAVFAGEIIHFDASGAIKNRLRVPAKRVTSLAFGGKDMQDLYVVTADNTENPAKKGTIFKTRSDIPGLVVSKARF